jgi:hypothetical protein
MIAQNALNTETGRIVVEDTRDLLETAIRNLQTALACVNGSLQDDHSAPMVELTWALETLFDTDHALSIAIQEIAAVVEGK